MRGFLRWRQELSPGRISSFDGGLGVTRPGGRCGRDRDRGDLGIIGSTPLPVLDLSVPMGFDGGNDSRAEELVLGLQGEKEGDARG